MKGIRIMNDKDKAFELNYEAIGRRIRTARKEEKLTQENLAEKMDISVAHVSGMENGNTGIGIQTLVKASNVLHVSTGFSMTILMNTQLILKQKSEIFSAGAAKIRKKHY